MTDETDERRSHRVIKEEHQITVWDDNDRLYPADDGASVAEMIGTSIPTHMHFTFDEAIKAGTAMVELAREGTISSISQRIRERIEMTTAARPAARGARIRQRPGQRPYWMPDGRDTTPIDDLTDDEIRQFMRQPPNVNDYRPATLDKISGNKTCGNCRHLSDDRDECLNMSRATYESYGCAETPENRILSPQPISVDPSYVCDLHQPEEKP